MSDDLTHYMEATARLVAERDEARAQRDRYAAVLRRISTFSVKVGNCKGCRESAHVKDLFYELREIAGAALEEKS